jgi:hypothetical protein
MILHHSVKNLSSSPVVSKNSKIKIYIAVILYGFETWKQSRLRMFANRVLRRVFGPKRVKVTRGWRKRHNE